MPRIDDSFLDCSIYLYPTEQDAIAGKSIGGSGFLAAVPGFGKHWLLGGECPVSGFHHYYAVSNKHVADKHPVVRLNSADGSVCVIPFTSDDWTYSQDHDIAAVAIEYRKGNKYLFVPIGRFLTVEMAQKYDVGIGDETFMVGRFINNEGKQNNQPSVRWGHVSMMPVIVQGDQRKIEKSFCVETHSVSGYSGSPVFVRPFTTEKLVTQYPGWSNSVANTAVLFSTPLPEHVRIPTIEQIPGGPWLLGIQWGYIHDASQQNTGMSGVAPAWHILDVLGREGSLMQRQKEQEQCATEHEGATETSADNTGVSRSEFEDVLKKVSRKQRPAAQPEPPSESAPDNA